jgi:hypothetical protein
MRRHTPEWALVVLTFATACASNVGILYTEYQQFSLASARITPEETSPIRVTMGWDQGSLAIVRRRGDEDSNVPQAGEAVSMIAKTELGSEFSLRPGEVRQRLLGADSYFISGSAAIVAAVEEGKEVSIRAGDDRVVTELETEGPPAERLMSALGGRIEELESLRGRIVEEQRRVDRLLDALDPSAYDDTRAQLIASGLAAADDPYDARTPVDKLRWLRKMSRADDTAQNLDRLRLFRAYLETR